MIKFRVLYVAVGLTLLSCAQNPLSKKPGPYTKPWPIEVKPGETIPPSEIAKELPSEKSYVEEAKPVAASPAVLALMQDAQYQGRQGNLDIAVSTLERALRIQPRNAELWNQLAMLRLKQERSKLAEDLAKKSNALAGDNYYLRRKNWTLIAAARRRMGNINGAREAEEKAGR